MKKFNIALLSAALTLALAGCSGGSPSDYDGELCSELSVKIERRDSLSQKDYSKMIGQDEAILKYIVARSKEIAALPDSSRVGAWRALTADPEYLERFGYLFTIGSALYNAERKGILSVGNSRRYAALDKYNEELTAYSERF